MMRPRAINVEPMENYILLVTFSDNDKRLFDMKPYLELKPFDQLKNKILFQAVRIGGLSVEWATGQDICPDELYFNSKSLKN
jgi:hypothetical protein